MGRLRCCRGKVVGEALVKDVQKMTASRVAQRMISEEAQRAVFVAMRFCRFCMAVGFAPKGIGSRCVMGGWR